MRARPLHRWRRLSAVVMVLLLGGCADSARTTPVQGDHSQFTLSDIAKSDMNMVLENHQREVMGHLQQLMEKLYRRNPRELAKNGPGSTQEQMAARVFGQNHQWRFPELGETTGVAAIHLAFDPAFSGDRVLALTVGLGSMLMASYGNKTQFFLTDDPNDPQKFYDSARNVEVTVWMLSNRRDAAGELFLLSNEGQGPVANLSFERLFGKIIAIQDVVAKIVAQKTKRTITRTIQFIASTVLIPI